MEYEWNFSIVWRHWDILLSGLIQTVYITLLAVVLGTVVAVGVLALRQSRMVGLSLLAKIFVEVFRGLPVLIVMFWMFYGLPILVGPLGLLTPYNVAIIALGLNFAALMTDILRSGYEAIPQGEIEVAHNFGFSRMQIFRHIIIPQAFWRSLAPTLGQAINTLKLSAVASFISVHELFYQTTNLIQDTARPLEFYTVVALLYLALVIPLSFLTQRMESSLKQRFLHE